MTKVSIVLPVYNVANYLPKCLDSLLAQTLEDIEIICVNDGSKDNSLTILQNYAAKDSRIIVIDQANSGPGAARNKGIISAQGEYIGFVDPDDWVDDDMYEKMYSAAQTHDADLVECGVITHNEKSGKTRSKLENFPLVPFSWKDNPQYLFGGITAGWNKLCRLDLLKREHIYYSEGYCAEDHIFTIGIRLAARKIVYINECMYHYLVRSQSVSRKTSTVNLKVPQFMGDVVQLLTNKGSYARVEESLLADISGMVAIHYTKIPKKNQSEYRELCRHYLPPKAFSMFDAYICPKRLKDYIYSVRYYTKGGHRYRCVTILGLTIKMKVNK